MAHKVPSYSLSMAARILLLICMLYVFKCHSKGSKHQIYTFISSGYIGCFDDQQQVLQHRLNDSNNNTGNQCKGRCYRNGYRFAGTKNTQCYCGNYTYTAIYDENGCIGNCPGDNCEKCGEHLQLSIFDTTRVDDGGCKSSKCKKGELCKEDKGGYLCISNYSTSETSSCPYIGATKVSSSTTVPTPTQANTTDRTDMVPVLNNFISNDIQLVNTNERQYLIYNRNLTYLGAQENCKMWKADIVTYTNPVQYINLQRNITINGAYWVGGGFEQTDDKCLVLDTRGSASLYSKPCTKMHYSICSRVDNISDILNKPEFVEIIQNLTVNSCKTTKMERKLNCSYDKRTSAKAIGAVIGAGVISFICSLLFLCDLQRICQHEKKH